ncbi:MAG: flagellin [Pseudomonadota bacterium]|jgi:flagellin|nr:flagellin [Alphaproteobacteria bacterium]MEC7702611.1 flagellin [Pseudomonadota bacterium]
MPVISTNTAANSALLNLNKNASMQEKYLNQLSSGSRINSSSDDAAGLAVSGQLQADITTLTQSARNAQQAEALLQTADGALARQGDILQRMKSLATQYNSGTVDATSRSFINAEYTELVEQLDLISTSTEFNGQALIDGSYNQNFVVGIDASDTISVDLSSVDTSSTGLNLSSTLSVSNSSILTLNLRDSGGDVATGATAITALSTGIIGAAAADTIDISIDINDDGDLLDAGDVAEQTFTVGTSTVADLVDFFNGINDANGDQVYSAEFTNGTLTVSLVDPNALDTSGDGNSNAAVDIDITDAASADLVIDGTGVGGAAITAATTELVSAGTALNTFADDLALIDTAITSIANARSQVGAFTSAFQFQNANINTQIENLSAAKSSIVDVDIAEAQTNFTNAQVLTEAATAALAQANQITTSLLSLLR